MLVDVDHGMPAGTKAATIVEFIQGLQGTLSLTFEEGLAQPRYTISETSRQLAGGLRSAKMPADELVLPRRAYWA